MGKIMPLALLAIHALRAHSVAFPAGEYPAFRESSSEQCPQFPEAKFGDLLEGSLREGNLLKIDAVEGATVPCSSTENCLTPCSCKRLRWYPRESSRPR